jgi:hypothetical protein
MYFPAEHLLDKLQISAQELSALEQKGIIKESLGWGVSFTRLAICTGSRESCSS